MFLEGETAGVEASSGSLAGNDSWEGLSQGGDGQVEASQAAAPVEQPETAQPETQPEQSAEAEPDKFAAITDPKREDWQALRGHKDELATKLTSVESKYNEVAPIVEKVQAVGGAATIDKLAALLTNPQPNADGLRTAGEFVDFLTAQDSLVGQLVAEAAFIKNADTYFDWALADRGLDRAAFDALLKGGSQQPQYVPTAYPVPDSEGVVRVPSPDGSGQLIELDTSDPRDLYTYQLGKREFEREQKAEQERQQAAASQRQTQEQQLRAQEDQRISEFLNNCDTDYEQQFGTLDLKVSDTPTKLQINGDKPLTETQAAQVLTLAISRFLLDTNDRHQATFKEGQEIARRGGQMAESKRLALKNDRDGILKKTSQFVKGLFSELHELRQRVAGGATGAPRMPADAVVITKPNGGVTSLPPANGGIADPYDEIWGR